MSGGTPKHSAIGNNIGGELRNLFRGQPCQVYNSDLRVGIMPIDVETYPDVTVVCGELHVNPFDKNSIINPAVIVEVLSPSTERYDRGEKWARYRRLDSLQEYLLVSQDKALVEQYVRQEDDNLEVYVRRGPGAGKHGCCAGRHAPAGRDLRPSDV